MTATERFESMSIKALEMFAKFSASNHKLVPNKETAFLIWNLPYKITCPFATEMCKLKCYAKKAEDLYPDCNPCRNRNWTFSRSAEFADWVIAYIEKKNAYNLKHNKKLVVRIHESGDFYNVKYFNKWMQVCKHFENVPNITFICYTKSLSYVINYINVNGALPSNLALRFSVWADTNPVHIALAEKYGIAIYTADDEQNITEETYPKYDVCRCSDCATCGHCWSKEDKYHKIVCAIH